MTLDGELRVDQGEHDTAVEGRQGAVDDRDITGEKAGPRHALARDPQREGGGRVVDQQLVEIERLVQIVLGRARESRRRRAT